MLHFTNKKIFVVFSLQLSTLFRRLLLAAKAFSLLIFLEKDFIDHFRHDAEQEDAEGFLSLSAGRRCESLTPSGAVSMVATARSMERMGSVHMAISYELLAVKAGHFNKMGAFSGFYSLYHVKMRLLQALIVTKIYISISHFDLKVL